jgi:hypothetical protein
MNKMSSLLWIENKHKLSKASLLLLKFMTNVPSVAKKSRMINCLIRTSYFFWMQWFSTSIAVNARNKQIRSMMRLGNLCMIISLLTNNSNMIRLSNNQRLWVGQRKKQRVLKKPKNSYWGLLFSSLSCF